MTDAEIKKALECCWHNNECIGNECPFFEPINDCTQLMAMEAIDLINRQQAEIEDVRNGVKSYKGKYESVKKTAMELQDVIKKKDAEIETLKIQNEHLATFWRETQQQLEDLEKEMDVMRSENRTNHLPRTKV